VVFFYLRGNHALLSFHNESKATLGRIGVPRTHFVFLAVTASLGDVGPCAAFALQAAFAPWAASLIRMASTEDVATLLAISVGLASFAALAPAATMELVGADLPTMADHHAVDATSDAWVTCAVAVSACCATGRRSADVDVAP
jgi:hypothetical protein